MCKVQACRKTYNINFSNDSIIFDHVIEIGSFITNQLKEKKLPLKMKLMKVSCRVVHHLTNHVLLLRKEIHEGIMSCHASPKGRCGTIVDAYS